MDGIGLIGGGTESGRDLARRRSGSNPGMNRLAPTDHIIVLNCFGRGGSGIAWRMIGSSPDVIMTSEEWHVGVFGVSKTLRKGVPLVFRSLGIGSFEPLRRYALRKTLEMRRPSDVTTKTDARSLVVKLMDYHIVFAQMIGTSFEQATFVNLTRHPYGQCESLMRSGLSLESACRWYDDVARMMVKQAESGAIRVRFEDVVTRPIETCDGLYRSLGVRWPKDGKFEFKVKPYGTDRMADVGIEDKGFIRIGPEDAAQHIDASVLRGETERLSAAQRRAIWDLTGSEAARLDYTAAGSFAALT
jgi:Sulfotransferase family